MLAFSSLFRVARTATLALVLAASIGAHASTIVGRVVGVADGDTVTVLDADRGDQAPQHVEDATGGGHFVAIPRKPHGARLARGG